MRRTCSIVVLVAAMAWIAHPVAAKEGVRAELERPVRLSGTPGKTITVAWRLVDEDGRRFGASGVYLRVTRCGRRPVDLRATARGEGRYAARLRMPRRGVRKLVVGLKGWRIIGERRERADVFFSFDPPIVRRCR
jgi:hypothetical protein